MPADRPPPAAARPGGGPAFAPAGEAARRLFGRLAQLRGDRALHPIGMVAEGRFRALGTPAGRGAELLSDGGERRALVRLSRGVGLPEPVPDVLGCAIRVPDAYGPRAHQDFALASSLPAPVGRHALVPALRLDAAFYSSVLLYRIAGDTVMLGASVDVLSGADGGGLEAMRRAAREGALRVTLSVASPLGAWAPVAAVDVERVGNGGEARVRFNPWNTGGGIAPTGIFQGLRDPAYRGSQAGSPGAD